MTSAPNRKTDRRRLTRAPCRRILRRAVRRLAPSGPDDLSAALRSWRRALRSHRRLMKLAPTFFDPAVVDQMRRQREDSERQWREWGPVLNKVYGVTSTDDRPDTRWDPVLPRSPRTRRAVEAELLQCELGMQAGHHHFARFKQRHLPHRLTLDQIARLLAISIRLRCVGLTGRKREAF